MAEIAGLAIGAAALAGTFKDVLELISLISASRTMTADYELLTIRLDVEKTLLLQWADRVKLGYPDYDKRLDDELVATAVIEAFTALRRLLKDASTLQGRYDMRSVEESIPANDRTNMENGNIGDSLGAHRMREVFRRVDAVATQKNPRRRWTSATKALRWIAQDSQKFERLIDHISVVITQINRLVPPSTEAILVFMAREDMQSLRNHRTLRTLSNHPFDVSKADEIFASGYVEELALHTLARPVESSTLLDEPGTSQVARLGQAADDTMKQRARELVIRALWFRGMDDRHELVLPPASKTLQWALQPPESPARWDSLEDWFRSGSGVYWVSGKAGCGKSTLLKHLYAYGTTRNLLERWKGDRRLIRASFFFYYLGTEIQKSYEGLTRTLLHSILSNEPSWIPEVLPGLWQEALDFGRVSNPPSAAETKVAFERFVSLCQTYDVRACLFLDGLDEYSGKVQVGLDLIRTLTSCQNVKVLASSRPEPAFVAAFDSKPKLRMHDLTHNDILTYCQDTVGGHYYMAMLMESNPIEASELLEELVSKADGVFLWVVLACRSLVDGFEAYDTMVQLRERVYELPPELGDMFTHMLGRVGRRYHSEMARLLWICHAAYQMETPLAFVGLALLNSFGMDIGATTMALAKLTDAEIFAKGRMFVGQLRSRCGGLVESDAWKVLDAHHSGKESVSSAWRPAFNPMEDLRECRVTFMHRTVADFLSTEAALEVDSLRTQLPESASIFVAVANGITSYRKTRMPSYDLYGMEPTKFAQWARLVNESGSQVSDLWPVLLPKLGRLLWETRPNWSTACLSPANEGFEESKAPLFLSVVLAIWMREVTYVESAAASGINLADVDRLGCFPLLYHALNEEISPLRGYSVYGSYPIDTTLALTKILRSSGCSSTRMRFGGDHTSRTPWGAWLDSLGPRGMEVRNSTECVEITAHFLLAGFRNQIDIISVIDFDHFKRRMRKILAGTQLELTEEEETATWKLLDDGSSG